MQPRGLEDVPEVSELIRTQQSRKEPLMVRSQSLQKLRESHKPLPEENLKAMALQDVRMASKVGFYMDRKDHHKVMLLPSSKKDAFGN